MQVSCLGLLCRLETAENEKLDIAGLSMETIVIKLYPGKLINPDLDIRICLLTR